MSESASGGEAPGARLSKIQASYRSKSRAAWLGAGAAAVLAVVFALWVIPWVPIGMTQDDLTPKVWVALVLAAGSALTGLLAFFTREPASTEGDVAQVFRGLLGQGERLKNQRQFTHRLARECESVQRDRRIALSLILVQVSLGEEGDDQGSGEALDHIMQTLAVTVRSSDVIGIAGDDEIGILAIGAGAEAREVICARFERALTTALAHASAGFQRGQPIFGSLMARLGALGRLGDPTLKLRQLVADTAVGGARRLNARQVRLDLLYDTRQPAHHEGAGAAAYQF